MLLLAVGVLFRLEISISQLTSRRSARLQGEDFSFFQEKVPGVYFFLGGMTAENTESFPHHTPDFMIDESGLLLGVKAFTQISIDYLNQ